MPGCPNNSTQKARFRKRRLLDEFRNQESPPPNFFAERHREILYYTPSSHKDSVQSEAYPSGNPFQAEGLHNQIDEVGIPPGKPLSPHCTVCNRRIGQRHEVCHREIPAVWPAPRERPKLATE